MAVANQTISLLRSRAHSRLVQQLNLEHLSLLLGAFDLGRRAALVMRLASRGQLVLRHSGTVEIIQRIFQEWMLLVFLLLARLLSTIPH